MILRRVVGRGRWIAPLVSLMMTPAAAVAQQSGFNEEEQTALAAGELVVHQESRRRGDLQLIGGTSYQVINRPPREVWRAILDTPRYTRFVPELQEARVDEENDDESLVFLRHRRGPLEASYYVTQQVDSETRTLRFRVDRSRPGDLNGGWGFIRIGAYGANRAIVTFGIFADIGRGLLTGLIRSSVHEWMMRIPELLKRYLRGSGRNRYRDRPT